MSEYGWVQIVALLGWLILAVGALASHRLNWSATIRLALIWAGIFVTVGLAVSLAMG